LIRLNKSELVFLTVNLLKTQMESLRSETLALMDKTTESLFFSVDT